MPRVWTDQDGSVVPFVAVSMFAVFGFAALALDAGYWFQRSALLSNAADLAAVSGARIAVPVDITNANALAAIATATTQIQAVANVTLGGSVTAPNIVFGCWNEATALFAPGVNCPAAGPGSVVAANAVGVRSADPTPQSFFAAVFGVAPVTVPNATVNLATLQNPTDCAATPNRCFAVAYRDFDLQACLIALSQEDDSLYLNGNITLNMPNCGVHANGGIDGSNNTLDVETPYICANGDIKNNGLASTASSYCGTMSAPAGPAFTLPTSPSFGNVQARNGNSSTYSGGGVFNRLDINRGGSVALNNGKYVVTSNITVQGTLTASNATIILRNGATINVQGNGAIPTMTAPTSGDTAGYMLVESCSSGCSGTSSLGGNTTLDYQGNVYLPNQTLQLRGTPSVSSVSASIVAYAVELRGNANWSNVTINPSGSGPLLPTRVHLVQ